jgi:hypothetical protein
LRALFASSLKLTDMEKIRILRWQRGLGMDEIKPLFVPSLIQISNRDEDLVEQG